MSPLLDTASLRIGFIHPDLGLGGAERLVVDAALQLKEAGHRVTIFTAHHDRTRCFEETRDGTLDIRVYGDFLPIHVGQHLRAPCTIARMSYLACAMTLCGGQFDVIFCDLVPHVIPLLRLLSRARIVFYCHFPDQLLTPERHFLYQLYRTPIDRSEEVSIAMADRVLVNSRFTAKVFRWTFPRLRTVTPEVLYPGVDITRYKPLGAQKWNEKDNPPGENGHGMIILSLSRYEPRKNIGLAIEAFALLRERLSETTFPRVRLIIAGGYDSRLRENRDTLHVLETCVERLHLEDHVVFIRSLPDAQRLELLSRCFCVVYTPENEHFGLVPLEAMAAGRPVIVVNSGGTLETVRHGETGLLCAPTPRAFADAMAQLILDRREAKRLGKAGQEHVERQFSRGAFGTRLEIIMRDLVRD